MASTTARFTPQSKNASTGKLPVKLVVGGGLPGTTPQGVSQTVLSADGRAVFIHLPALAAAMQLEVRHHFQCADGGPAAPGTVYFKIESLILFLIRTSRQSPANQAAEDE